MKAIYLQCWTEKLVSVVDFCAHVYRSGDVINVMGTPPFLTLNTSIPTFFLKDKFYMFLFAKLQLCWRCWDSRNSAVQQRKYKESVICVFSCVFRYETVLNIVNAVFFPPCVFVACFWIQCLRHKDMPGLGYLVAVGVNGCLSLRVNLVII